MLGHAGIMTTIVIVEDFLISFFELFCLDIYTKYNHFFPLSIQENDYLLLTIMGKVQNLQLYIVIFLMDLLQ